MAANDNERAVDRPCELCGHQFETGSFLIAGGRVISIVCAACFDPAQDFRARNAP